MNELIREMLKQGFVIAGKAEQVFLVIGILPTIDYKPDEIDWACKLALVRN
jgi:hypothetical protein